MRLSVIGEQPEPSVTQKTCPQAYSTPKQVTKTEILNMERYTKAFFLVAMICPFFLNGLGWDLISSYMGRTVDHGPSSNGLHAQIFSLDPLIIYIENFVSQDEIDHLLKISNGKYAPSMVYPGGKAYVNTKDRVSESAVLPPDEIVTRIENRALSFQGWRGNNTYMQPMKTQRYGVNGFYTFHYDWDSLRVDGNRVTTYMVYLVADCTGGGTNFPRLQRPNDTRWCNVIDCEEDEYDGVTFKPRVGAAVFWENMYPNGSFHWDVRHASLPVKSGEKVGLNIWGWDKSWRPPLEL